MKSCHDIVSVINEETLGSIRECYSILKEYALRAPLPEQQPYNPGPSKISISGAEREEHSGTMAESSPLEVEEIQVETMTKRPVRSSAPDQATTGRPGKWVKIVVRKHKSHHSEGSSRAIALEKEPEAPAEEDSSPSYRKLRSMKDLCEQGFTRMIKGHHYQMALLDRVHDAGHLVTIMGNRTSLLEAKIDKLKTEGDPEQLAATRQQVDELQADNAKLKSELDELTCRSD
ncbi:hypothetical protein BHE74_00042653 [Ensete ventricosum]|nr:hypothetical protein BHE74_00042653 [Ensete ventricosum]